MSEKSLLIFSLVFSAAVRGLSLPLSPIHVHEGNFVDQDGRVRMFRGINSEKNNNNNHVSLSLFFNLDFASPSQGIFSMTELPV